MSASAITRLGLFDVHAPLVTALPVTWQRRTARGVVLLAVASCAAAAATRVDMELSRRNRQLAVPAVASLNIVDVLVDTRPITLTVTAAWQKVPETVSRHQVLTDVTLWRRMHFDDWDGVPAPLRARALDSMLARYEHVLAQPAVWDRMDAFDWDVVPQPIRTVAFRHMADYWSGYYALGGQAGLPPRFAADLVSAIVMSESWFDHRAVHTNRWGNRDLGVAQASDRARQRLRDLHASGAVDVWLEDEDYFDPWRGTRFVALWFSRLLDEVGGDVDTAIGAYHRGIPRAHDQLGTEYTRRVRERLDTYIRNRSPSATWDHLWCRGRELTAIRRPWLSRAAGTACIGVEDAVRELPPHGVPMTPFRE